MKKEEGLRGARGVATELLSSGTVCAVLSIDSEKLVRTYMFFLLLVEDLDYNF